MIRSGRLRCTTIRRGLSLIEVMGLLIVLSMVMVLAGTAIHRVTVTQTMTLGCVRYSKSLEDLRHRLCIDLRSAEQFKGIATGIQLNMADGQVVEYVVDTGFVVRKTRSNEGAVAGQNRWSVGAQGLTMELDSAGEIPLGRLELNLDRKLLPGSGQSSQGTDPSTNLTGIETVRWVSRLSRGAR